MPLSPVMRTLTWCRGDLAGEQHQLAHASGDDGVIAFDGEFVDGPEGEALLAFDPPAFDFLAAAMMKPMLFTVAWDSTSGSGCSMSSTLRSRDVPIANVRVAAGSVMVPHSARQFFAVVRCARHGASAVTARGVLDDGDEAGGDEFGAAGVHQQGCEFLKSLRFVRLSM